MGQKLIVMRERNPKLLSLIRSSESSTLLDRPQGFWCVKPCFGRRLRDRVPRNSCGKFLLLYEYRKKQSTANDRPSNMIRENRCNETGRRKCLETCLGRNYVFMRYRVGEISGLYVVLWSCGGQVSRLLRAIQAIQAIQPSQHPKNDTVLLGTAWFGDLANYPCSYLLA